MTSSTESLHPEDGRLIPFDTYNLFFRDGLEAEVLEPLRAELVGAVVHPPAPQSLPGSSLQVDA